MSVQQVPALTPSLPGPSNNPPSQPKSRVALHGATSAFLPKPAAPTISISTASAGARRAAFAAGTQSQHRAVSRSPERRNGRQDPSPPRGRPLYSNVGVTVGNPDSEEISNALRLLPRPALQSRSSSTLAARHLSIHSRSPQRSLSRDPCTSGASVNLTYEPDRYSSNSDALYGAKASMTLNAAKESSQGEPIQLVKSRVQTFEKLPASAPSSTTPIADGAVSGSTSFGPITHSQPTKRIVPVKAYSLVQKSSQTRQPLSDIVRQSSEVTIPTTTKPRAANELEGSQPPDGQFPPIVQRSLTSKHPQAKSPPQASIRYPEQRKSSLTVNELADAMVASSLASSRAASPTKKTSQPSPVSRRRSRSLATLREFKSLVDTENSSRQQRQSRPMKHTLRKQGSSDDEDLGLAKRGRRHWMRKHPNKHAEGDRKRWRDKVTERERKRYEGVFAANRGLLIGSGHFEPSPSALSDNATEGNHVVNVIVRDIWERSRLPREALKEIYELVSPEEVLALNREQFVVGLWLIDQRLKGRKLPIKVSNSVWSSVRHSQGIKIRKQHA